MFKNFHERGSKAQSNFLRGCGWRGLIAVVLMLMVKVASAQTTGTIEGTVRDTSGALNPKATVTLINISSKSKRDTVSNGQGDFTITAVPAATYDMLVTMQGFDAYRVKGIEMHPGDSINISTIALKLGEVATEIDVTATQAGVNLDSPEKSALITAEDIKRLSTVGRDATELIKFLPGFAVSTGGNLSNVATQNNAQNMGFSSSSVSQFSANGSTPQTGATTVVSDGVSAMDPGDMGATIQNVNMDMVQEIKVQTSNFGADSAKGPVVINAVGKAGGTQFHGSAYIFARNGVLNANDWYSNDYGSPRPPSSYYYPGGNIGGPVLIPGTSFNHNRKLRFFSGFEYYDQTQFYGLLQAFIPTARMLSGDLTPAAIAAPDALNVTPQQLTAACPNDYTTSVGSSPSLNGLGGICYSPGYNNGLPTYTMQDQIISGGTIASGGLLKVDQRALIYSKFWPTPNRVARAQPAQNLLSDGFNYQRALTNTINGYQFQTSVDEDITDNTKLKVTYKLEKSNYVEPVKNEFYAGNDIIPYPTPEDSRSLSQGVTFNFTKTFGPVMTNELVGGGILFNQPAQFENPGLVQDSSTGWSGGRYYNNGAMQLPGIVDYEEGTPDFAMAYDPLNGGKFLHKFSYNVGDNLTRQIRAHSLKAGIYFETSGNNQVPYTFTQGEYAFDHYDAGCATPGGHVSQLQNSIADFLQGCGGFTQTSASLPENLRFHMGDFFLNDEWKTTRKLTLTLGIRFEHLGAWYSPDGVGMAVWNAPAQHILAPLTPSAVLNVRNYPGISWHQTDASIPISGQPTRPLFYTPRVGLAYDLYGTGKTVFRGGWGAYRFHDSYNDSAGALATTRGITTYSTPPNVSCTYDQITQAQTNNQTLGQGCLSITSNNNVAIVNPNSNSTVVAPFSIYALNQHDDKQPVTYNYNFTVDQVMPHGVGDLEISYVGNRSADTFTAGNLSNQNYIPLGGLFQPDPLTGNVYIPGSSQQNVNDYRPYPNYVAVYVPNHIGYGNYNALQTSFNRRKGSFIYGVNYTWSKALGIRGDNRTGAVGDPSNLRHDYGYLGFNRSQIFNVTYSWQVGHLYKGNRFVAATVNNWEFSGILGLQSGPDISVSNNGNANFGLSANASYTPPGSNVTINDLGGNTSVLGTPDISLQPLVTCNPKSNLHYNPLYGRQYINGNCFALPQYGSNGNFELPDIHGPAYFNTDLTVRRSFQLRAKQSLQFSIAGFNFLNHPLPSFGVGNQLGLNLAFTGTGTTAQQAYSSAIQTNQNFGYTPYKQGFRIVELSARYNF